MKNEHVVVFIEEMKSEFKSLAEAHTALRDEMRREFKEVRKESADQEKRLLGMMSLLSTKDELREVVAKLATKDELKQAVSELKTEITKIADNLNAHRIDTEAHGKGYKIADSE